MIHSGRAPHYVTVELRVTSTDARPSSAYALACDKRSASLTLAAMRYRVADMTTASAASYVKMISLGKHAQKSL